MTFLAEVLAGMLFEFDHMFWGHPAKSTMTKWYREFQFGRQILEDNNRCRRLVTAVTVENVVREKSLIKEDTRITHEEIQDTLGISSVCVNQILHDHLGVLKRCAHRVPHNLTER